MRTVTWIVVVVCGTLCCEGLASSPGVRCPPMGPSGPNQKTADEARDRARSAVVRITVGERRSGASVPGVIVSEEGIVVTAQPRTLIHRNLPIHVVLSDGRTVEAEALGWSTEFRLGLLRITGSGPWPHVPLTARGSVTVGDACFGFGSGRRGAAPSGASRAMMGSVDRAVGTMWGTTNVPRWSIGDPVFADTGDLIGMTTWQAAPFFRDLEPNPRGAPAPVVTFSDVLREHWDDLVEGRNLDAQRLQLQSEASVGPTPPSKRPEPPEEQILESIERAKSASIRLRRKGAGQHWGSSGVVIDAEGTILSCGHHFLLPGDEIVVTFADGAEVEGRILGTNWVTDISVARITDPGPWPHASLGHSLAMNDGDGCFTLGYPARRRRDGSWESRELALRRTKITASPQAPLTIYVAANGERVSGESGGGLFDLRGRVIGVGESVSGGKTDHVRVEVFRRQWESLTEQGPVGGGGEND